MGQTKITPMLSKLCISWEELHPELFLKETKELLKLEEKLKSHIPDNLETDEYSNLLQLYGSEYKTIGFIDGFKTGIRLLSELQLAENSDFLKELLTLEFDDFM